MGNKGVQRRRRNALAANSSNLHKAQFGKASKFDKLPEPPKSGDFAQPLSKSTRKVQALMAKMASQSGGQQNSEAAVGECREQDASEGADCRTTVGGGKKSAELHQERLNSDGGVTGPSAPAKISKTKLKTKQHLAEKKLEKRRKFQDKQQNGSKQSEDKDDFKSNAFKLEHVPFGEVAHAPPQVSLKRRNHVDERGGGSRHGLALQKHLQAGEAKLLMGKQETAEAREAVMEAYRASKSKQTNGGECRVANMDSLKALVRSQAAAKQVSQAGTSV